MNAEITDINARNPAGSIYFDGKCRFCVAHRERWGSVFERRGFVWRPLQIPGTAERLGITEAQLQAEMWLQLADGRRFSGINAWSAVMRSCGHLESCLPCLVLTPWGVPYIAGLRSTAIASAARARFRDVLIPLPRMTSTA